MNGSTRPALKLTRMALIRLNFRASGHTHTHTHTHPHTHTHTHTGRPGPDGLADVEDVLPPLRRMVTHSLDDASTAPTRLQHPRFCLSRACLHNNGAFAKGFLQLLVTASSPASCCDRSLEPLAPAPLLPGLGTPSPMPLLAQTAFPASGADCFPSFLCRLPSVHINMHLDLSPCWRRAASLHLPAARVCIRVCRVRASRRPPAGEGVCSSIL